MTKYIAIKYPEYTVDCFIDITDNQTLDGGEQIPDYIGMLVPAHKFEILPEIGMKWNPDTQTFE